MYKGGGANTPQGRGPRATVAKQTGRPESPVSDRETEKYITHAYMNDNRDFYMSKISQAGTCTGLQQLMVKLYNKGTSINH